MLCLGTDGNFTSSNTTDSTQLPCQPSSAQTPKGAGTNLPNPLNPIQEDGLHQWNYWGAPWSHDFDWGTLQETETDLPRPTSPCPISIQSNDVCSMCGKWFLFCDCSLAMREIDSMLA